MVLPVNPPAVDVYQTALLMAKGGYGWEDCCVELRRQGAVFSRDYVKMLVLKQAKIRRAAT